MKSLYANLLGLALAVLLVAGLAPVVLASEEEGHHGERGQEAVAGTVQNMCPVLPGNKIDPDIFTEYMGKRVYFCCPSCKAAFLKDPERYVPRLPQFSGSEHAAHAHAHASPAGDRGSGGAGTGSP